MIITLVPLLVAIIGLLMYVLASNAKLVEIGRILLFVGLLWLVYATAGKTIKLL